MRIRPAHLETEALTISQIYTKSWQAAYQGIIPDSYLQSLRGDEWAQRLVDDNRTVMVLEDCTALVGVATIGPGRDAKWQDAGELMSIYLLPTVMHHGYGAMLLAAAEPQLVAQGFHTIYLWVLAANTSSRHFYEKHGYVETNDVKVLMISGQPLETLCYVKTKTTAK